MQVYDSVAHARLASGSVLSVGNYDGVHRGHQHLIGQMRAQARAVGLQVGLVTFDPHPLAVLRPELKLANLTSLSERLALLARAGLDFAVVQPFTKETAQTSAHDFLAQLARQLQLKSLWVGPDFALGRGREASGPGLDRLGEVLGFGVHTIPPYYLEGVEVRSGLVRQHLQAGHVGQAAQMLGRLYRMEGRVVEGARRGHIIGFPTANLEVDEGRIVPANGVYAAWAEVGAEKWPTAVNIGLRPSFNGDTRLIEAHLIGYEGDLYGQQIGLQFLQRLRDEMRFDGVAPLKVQLVRDTEMAERLLATDVRFYEEVEHTADWAIHVWGRNLTELYAHAAQAMFEMMGEGDSTEAAVQHEVSIEDVDTEAVLVAWLNELLLLQELHHEMYSRFEVRVATTTDLRATVKGTAGQPTGAKIKAVTFHDLQVVETADGYEATLVFDV